MSLFLTLPLLLTCLYRARTVGVINMCKGCLYFCYFSIRFWNCSNRGLSSVFHFFVFITGLPWELYYEWKVPVLTIYLFIRKYKICFNLQMNLFSQKEIFQAILCKLFILCIISIKNLLFINTPFYIHCAIQIFIFHF